jgi:hypothetical protein
MELSKYKTDIIQWIVILGILVTMFTLGRCSKVCEKQVVTQIKTKTDTAYIVKKSEPIIMTKFIPKLIYKSDTVIVTKPFTAIVDTIILKDTVKARYDFPENSFDLFIKRKPDSLMVQTVTITKEVMRDRSWWETPAYILGGTVAGLLIGRATR